MPSPSRVCHTRTPSLSPWNLRPEVSNVIETDDGIRDPMRYGVTIAAVLRQLLPLAPQSTIACEGLLPQSNVRQKIGGRTCCWHNSEPGNASRLPRPLAIPPARFHATWSA